MTVAFAERFGIRPWEMGRLTYEQFCDLENRIEQLRG
jgi:hypothetical protein